MQIPKRKSEQTNRYQDDDAHLTPQGIEKLKNELERLETVSKPRAIAELQRTAAMGDFSENAAYSEAKGKLRGINSRIMIFTEKIKNAVPIQVSAGNAITVQIGTTITVLVNDRERTFEIVGSQETNPSSGRISYRSPVGAALMHHAAGDEIPININGKTVHYKILKIK